MESRTQLIPLLELTPGAVGAIRNQVIRSVVTLASQQLGLTEDKLVVRDIRPLSDLALYDDFAGTARAAEDWTLASTATSAGYHSATGTATMGDQRYVAIFGVRDLRLGFGAHATGTTSQTTKVVWTSFVSLIKINVGGADKVVWDTKCMQAYKDNLVAFAPSAVIIPQNTSYNISLYTTRTAAGAGGAIMLQLIGVVVEPRGKLVSP